MSSLIEKQEVARRLRRTVDAVMTIPSGEAMMGFGPMGARERALYAQRIQAALREIVNYINLIAQIAELGDARDLPSPVVSRNLWELHPSYGPARMGEPARPTEPMAPNRGEMIDTGHPLPLGYRR